ncbi:hypothetical protein B0H10DRAFT_1970473 [Mycena sp. CBHHK59/15]|nr:hypothetical protein B0H10DRAFT_1970473 [Mycena sp. CBHHK59/15]
MGWRCNCTHILAVVGSGMDEVGDQRMNEHEYMPASPAIGAACFGSTQKLRKDVRESCGDTHSPTRDNPSAPEAATKGLKQQGGAEESGPSKHQEQPYQALEMGDNPNTKIQRLRAQKMVSDAAYWVNKLHVYVCIVQLLLEDEDSIQAETHYNHSMLLVHSTSDKETLLQFKLCQARISDYRCKFLEAAS